MSTMLPECHQSMENCIVRKISKQNTSQPVTDILTCDQKFLCLFISIFILTDANCIRVAILGSIFFI